MGPIALGIMAVAGFLLLAMLGLPLGFSFTVVGLIGLILTQGLTSALSLLGEAPYSWTSSYVLCAIPLFVLMGQFAFHSRISGDLYISANRWLNRLPGGLAIATMLACTGFAACTGSSVASAATMGTIAFPEMEGFGYDRKLSTGTIAAGGTLGILIPPSTIFVIYGVMTETSIAALFIAGILPGLMLSAMFCVLIFVMCKRNPRLGPPGEAFGWKEKFTSLTGVWGMLILFLLVIGGLYFGIFAPSEAGTIGSFGAFILLLARRLPKSTVLTALIESARTTCYMLFILIGAMIFNTFLAVSGVPAAISEWVTGLPLPPMGIMVVILILYVPLGMFIDSLGMILLTIPILFPVITSLGFNAIWFGVLIVLMTELALLSPPVALNVYVVQGVTKVPFAQVARGIVPFAVVLLFGIAILVAFPKISLFLPAMMKYK